VILEGLVSTQNEDGSANISPMGPLVDETMDQFVLRPYRSSRTYANLKRSEQGVLHVTDDVNMLARAAVGRLQPLPKLASAKEVQGFIIAGACRWYEFRVTLLDDKAQRTTIACDVVKKGRIRDFFGFNRAKHAVVEASILATRLGLLPTEEVVAELDRLRVIVDKTAGRQERRAFQFIEQYVTGVLNR
jgi:hypothetical protein